MPAPATLETPRTLASTASVQEGQGVAHTKRRTSGTAATPAETVGQRLARLRRERGLTQVELAERLGIAQPIVSDYERGSFASTASSSSASPRSWASMSTNCSA